MIRVPLQRLKPGMTLAMPIRAPDGAVLLNSGVTLKPAFIRRLGQLGLTGAYIRDGVADDVPPQAPISDQTRVLAMASVREVFDQVTQGGSLANLGAVRRAVDGILDELLAHPGVLLGLTQVRSSDDYTFAHSVDVGVMALITGIAMGYGRSRLVDLGMGALLHDIGKTQVNPGILMKRGSLNSLETRDMRLHTVHGFGILRNRPDVGLLSAHVAYQHHERNDGSGYPRALRESQIHPFAQIVAVVDVYDAMTSDRPYRRGLPAFEAARFLQRTRGKLFSVVVVERFLSRVPLYATGTVVQLSTGEIGIVISQNPGDLGRPVVRLITDPNRRRLRRPITVDLLHDRERSVAATAEWVPRPGNGPAR